MNNCTIFEYLERILKSQNKKWHILILISLLNSCDIEQKRSTMQNIFQITEIVITKNYRGVSLHWYFGIRIKSNIALSTNDNIQINVFGIRDESNQMMNIYADSSITISTPKLTSEPERLLDKILQYPIFVRIICNGKTDYISYNKLTSIKINKNYNEYSVIKTIRNPSCSNFLLNIPDKLIYEKCPENLEMLEIK